MKKTQKVMAGISTTALALSLTGCGDDRPPVPDDNACNEWEWDDNQGVWECDDDDSNYYGHYYHGGKYYRSLSLLKNSKAYKKYKSSSSFKGGKKASSGFGSASRGFGG